MEIKNIIFDLDGVLVDTENLHFQGWNVALKNFNKSISKETYTCKYCGKDGKIVSNLLKKEFFIKSDLLRLKDTWLFKKLKEDITLIKNNYVKKVLIDLKHSGFRLFLASSGSKEEVIFKLKKEGLDYFFEDISTSNDVKKGKPYPYIYESIMKKNKLNSYKTIVVEDSQAGVESAVRAGLAVILIPTEYTSKDAHILANVTIKNIKQLHPFIKNSKRKIVVMSHVSHDIYGDIVYLGGPVSYVGRILTNLGAECTLIGKINKNSLFLSWLEKNLKNFIPIFCKNTTTFDMHFGEGNRTTIPLTVASKWSLNEVNNHLKSEFLLISPIVNDFSASLCKSIRNLYKGKIIYDPFNHDHGIFTSNEKKYFEILCNHADIIKISDNEILGILGKKKLSSCLKEIKKYTCIFLVTKGSKGVSLIYKGEVLHNIKAKKFRNTIDTTGCGDVFLGGLIYGLSKNKSLKDSINIGNLCAGIATLSKGVVQLPLRKKLIHSFNVEHIKIS